ncbi:MAG TPA: hypothetical protein VGM03_24795, partial [Phycisphaerae bacterium]
MRATRIAWYRPLLLPIAAVSVLLLIFQGPATAGFDARGIELAPGFTFTTYVSGTGFGPDANARGIPAIVAATFDFQGNLYFAR